MTASAGTISGDSPKGGGLSAGTLKLIAISAMLVDHIAWAFVPTASILGQFMHIIGRITGPVMCFFIAEGYYKTRSVPRYALRLALFAAVSYVPFIFFETGALPARGSFLTLNVLYTLLLGLLALWAWDRIESRPLAAAAVTGLCVLAFLGDWSVFGVAFVLAFGIHHGNFKKQAQAYSAVCACMFLFLLLPMLALFPLRDSPEFKEAFARAGGYFPTLFYQLFFQLGVFLPILLLRRYNGLRGGGSCGKWLFYIFYPAHLLVIGGIRLFAAGN